VRLNKRTQKWEAYIRVAGKHVHLGCYDSEVAAAQAFDQAALVRQAHNLGAMGGKPQLVTNFPPMIYLVCTSCCFQRRTLIVSHRLRLSSLVFSGVLPVDVPADSQLATVDAFPRTIVSSVAHSKKISEE
jgi:hypothetical protein